MTTGDIKTALRMLDAIDRRDWAGVRALSTPATTVYVAGEKLDVASWIGIGRMFYAGFSDARHEVESVIADGDRVVLRCIWRGTHCGDFQDIPATSKRVAVASYIELRIVGGLVVEYGGLFDAMGLARQLGTIATRTTTRAASIAATAPSPES
jgi:predicted ester cyclase